MAQILRIALTGGQHVVLREDGTVLATHPGKASALDAAITHLHAGEGGEVLVLSESGRPSSRIPVTGSQRAVDTEPPASPRATSEGLHPKGQGTKGTGVGLGKLVDGAAEMVDESLGLKAKDPSPAEPKVDEIGLDRINSSIDELTKRQRETWWHGLSGEERLAWSVLVLAGLVGPLGMGVMAALGQLYRGGVPSINQFEAVALLAIVAAPVFLGASVLLLTARLGAVAFMWAAMAALAGGAATSSLGPTTSLGNFYCYRSFSVSEHACRVFDQAGFAQSAHAAGGGPSGGARVLGFAVAYTADARGLLMAVCGVVAGLAAGYLIRQVMVAG